MMASRHARIFERVDAFEHEFCRSLNRGCRRPAVRNVFAIASRLGDGVFWYVLLLLIPVVHGESGIWASLHMGLCSLVGIAIYKLLKGRLVRERPCVTFEGILAGAVPLDRYSFPSGHTLHAVMFTLLATSYYPGLAWLLVPFATLVAASRVVLGLHYPSDVVAGAALGALLATLGLALVP